MWRPISKISLFQSSGYFCWIRSLSPLISPLSSLFSYSSLLFFFISSFSFSSLVNLPIKGEFKRTNPLWTDRRVVNDEAYLPEPGALEEGGPAPTQREDHLVPTKSVYSHRKQKIKMSNKVKIFWLFLSSIQNSSIKREGEIYGRIRFVLDRIWKYF